MELIIDISEFEYEAVKLYPECFNFANAIINGTPLPRGHGRLIDADKILEQMRDTIEMQELYLPIHFQELVVDEMPTILEATR